MYFQPPPYGQMPPPYGMGFGPHHGGHFGGAYGAPHHSSGGRAPRPGFQNRTWVNPNAVKTDDAAAPAPAADGATSEKQPTNTDALNANAPAFAPRNNSNPYYNSSQQQMRPRLFQNKTWVRPDTAKDEDFSLTLPVTPPPSGADNSTEATTAATAE